MKDEKLILVGHGACGKDYASNKLKEMGLKKAISYTSRPQRPNEVDGVDYHFISSDKFKEMIDSNEFYEYEMFKEDWYYGSTKKDWNECNLFIKTRGGVENISKEDREKCFVVFLNIDESIRYQRLLERADNNDGISRRIESDRVDFHGFNDYDMMIIDEKFDVNLIYDMMY
jgi:guanylate kinase